MTEPRESTSLLPSVSLQGRFSVPESHPLSDGNLPCAKNSTLRPLAPDSLVSSLYYTSPKDLTHTVISPLSYPGHPGKNRIPRFIGWYECPRTCARVCMCVLIFSFTLFVENLATEEHPVLLRFISKTNQHNVSLLRNGTRFYGGRDS